MRSFNILLLYSIELQQMGSEDGDADHEEAEPHMDESMEIILDPS